MSGIVLKPAIAGIFCGISAWSGFGLLQRELSQGVSTILAVAIGAFVYLLVLLIVKGISRQDVRMLPKGEKIAKTLEKWGLLG